MTNKVLREAIGNSGTPLVAGRGFRAIPASAQGDPSNGEDSVIGKVVEEDVVGVAYSTAATGNPVVMESIRKVADPALKLQYPQVKTEPTPRIKAPLW